MERNLSCLPRLIKDLGFGWLSITVAVVEAVEVADKVGDKGGCMLSDGRDIVSVGVRMKGYEGRERKRRGGWMKA